MWCVPMTPGSWKIGASTSPAAARRLAREDVEAGADALLRDRALERRLVDDLGARRVDEEGAGPHGGEELLADHALRLGLQGDVHAHDVGGGGDLQRRALALDAESAARARASGCGSRRRPAFRRRAPRGTISRPIPPDADQAERAAEEGPSALLYSFLFQTPRFRSAALSDDPPVEREDQPERELRPPRSSSSRDSWRRRSRARTPPRRRSCCSRRRPG